MNKYLMTIQYTAIHQATLAILADDQEEAEEVALEAYEENQNSAWCSLPWTNQRFNLDIKCTGTLAKDGDDLSRFINQCVKEAV